MICQKPVFYHENDVLHLIIANAIDYKKLFEGRFV